MPNDLFQWEAAGGLVHHCPQCFKPLTTPQTRTRCLGEHVEWCKQYHTQLFKKGTSNQCEPCRRGEEEHTKRHREIAELLHDLKPPLTPQTPQPIPPADSTKKERKAAKKVQKSAARAKVVTAADIAFVARILHPTEEDVDDQEELERRRLLEDPDINSNRNFHKHTSNARDVRLQHVKRDQKNRRASAVPREEVDAILLQLGATAEVLRRKVEEDLAQVEREREGMMMRKAGFWRWASKKAYKRLVRNGGIWGQKGERRLFDDDGDAVAGAEEEMDVTTAEIPPEPEPRKPVEDADVDVDDDDGWTTIANNNNKHGKVVKKTKTKKKPAPLTGNLKLVHNGGLSKLAPTPTRAQGRAFYSDVVFGTAEGDD